jgi:hypothetical protein
VTFYGGIDGNYTRTHSEKGWFYRERSIKYGWLHYNLKLKYNILSLTAHTSVHLDAVHRVSFSDLSTSFQKDHYAIPTGPNNRTTNSEDEDEDSWITPT